MARHLLVRLIVATVAITVASLRGVTAGTPSPGCGKTPTPITDGSATTPLTLTSNGKTRRSYVKLPDDYDNSHPYPAHLHVARPRRDRPAGHRRDGRLPVVLSPFFRFVLLDFRRAN
ncbi:uncharacterized protein P884DRAFT_317548 [Thermothelomyces heterothallicus CBS 202.75]|uniref:uncharacterized protein n=1 Tax=Thermothelomyces heterothallicus CBS 202.75 TaxID=1149848 RepID=UPI003741FD10